MPVPGITKSGFVDVEKYLKHKDEILKNSTAVQIIEDGEYVQGKTDKQLSEELNLTLWEVREIRAIAKRDAVELEVWREADENMQRKHEEFVLKIDRKAK